MFQFLSTYLRTLKASWLERKIPNISEENAEFIKNLIREQKPHHILEIGTANGYSTLCFAQAVMRDDVWIMSSIEPQLKTENSQMKTDITTIESAWNAHIEAVEHFKNCKIKNIHANWGDAKAVIPSLRDDYFDFVYIDAMKREYLDYLLLALPKMTQNALIVIDDVEKFRYKMENLYEWLAKNKIPYTLEKTDVDDSIMLIERSNIQLIRPR